MSLLSDLIESEPVQTLSFLTRVSEPFHLTHIQLPIPQEREGTPSEEPNHERHG